MRFYYPDESEVEPPPTDEELYEEEDEYMWGRDENGVLVASGLEEWREDAQ